MNKKNMFVGNNKTKVYHVINCYCVKQILPNNRVDVNEELSDTKGNTYHACSKCIINNDLITFD